MMLLLFLEPKSTCHTTILSFSGESSHSIPPLHFLLTYLHSLLALPPKTISSCTLHNLRCRIFVFSFSLWKSIWEECRHPIRCCQMTIWWRFLDWVVGWVIIVRQDHRVGRSVGKIIMNLFRQQV